MDEPVKTSRPRGTHRRRGVLLGVAGLAIAITVVALVLFQPWKLWVDDTVDEAAPPDAFAITAPPAVPPSSTPTPSVATTTAPSRTAEIAPPSTTPAPAVDTTAPAITVAPPTSAPTTTVLPPMPLGGSFVGIDHGTSGSVTLLQDPSGTQFARIENLDTSNGPDLFVYLSTNPPDGPEGQFDDDIVDLGRLRGNIGSANYEIPAGTDLARYSSVVIWCDRFNSAFGAAPLR